jgi:hypothetical protein
MLVRLLRANHLYNYILFPIIGALLLGNTFFQTIPIGGSNIVEPQAFFFPFSTRILSLQWAVAINLGLMMIICIQLLHLNSRFTFSNERTFLPVYIYLFITYAINDFHFAQPVFFSTIFVLLAVFALFDSFEKRTAYTYAFNAGLLIGISAIFCFQLIFLILLIPLCIFEIRGKTEWRELLLPLFGAMLPWVFFVSFYYVTDNFHQFIETFKTYFTTNEHTLFEHWSSISFLAYIALLILLSSLSILNDFAKLNIGTRRFFKVFFYIFMGVLIIFTLPFSPFQLIVITSIPLSFLISNFFINFKHRFWPGTLMLILVLFAFLLQFIR